MGSMYGDRKTKAAELKPDTIILKRLAEGIMAANESSDRKHAAGLELARQQEEDRLDAQAIRAGEKLNHSRFHLLTSDPKLQKAIDEVIRTHWDRNAYASRDSQDRDGLMRIDNLCKVTLSGPIADSYATGQGSIKGHVHALQKGLKQSLKAMLLIPMNKEEGGLSARILKKLLVMSESFWTSEDAFALRGVYMGSEEHLQMGGWDSYAILIRTWCNFLLVLTPGQVSRNVCDEWCATFDLCLRLDPRTQNQRAEQVWANMVIAPFHAWLRQFNLVKKSDDLQQRLPMLEEYVSYKWLNAHKDDITELRRVLLSNMDKIRGGTHLSWPTKEVYPMLKKRGNSEGGQTGPDAKRAKQNANDKNAAEAKAKQNRVAAKARTITPTAPSPAKGATPQATDQKTIFSPAIITKLGEVAAAAGITKLCRYHAGHTFGGKNKKGESIYTKCRFGKECSASHDFPSDAIADFKKLLQSDQKHCSRKEHQDVPPEA